MDTDYYKTEFHKWLVMADHHYLSARILMMHGLLITGLHTAATAVELYLKCGLVLIDKLGEKITHDLKRGFDLLEIELDVDTTSFITTLENSYHNKYPDNWEGEVIWKGHLEETDSLICTLRNSLHSMVNEQFNVEDHLKIAKDIGHFIPDISARFGSLNLKEVFLRSNRIFGKFKSFS